MHIIYESKDRELEISQEISKLNSELNTIRDKIKKIENSSEYNDMINKYIDKDPSVSIDDVNSFLDSLGYNSLSKRKKDIEKEIKSLRDEYDKSYSDRVKEEEENKKKSSGLSDPDFYDKEAEKEFGYTSSFSEAGYILRNGKMLNFSGEKGKHYGSRGNDHRAIGVIFADPNIQSSKAMYKYMSFGNIRIMPEANALDICANVPPTNAQRNRIKEFVTRNRKQDFLIDFTDTTNESVVHSIEYEECPSSATVLMDIDEFYKNK